MQAIKVVFKGRLCFAIVCVVLNMMTKAYGVPKVPAMHNNIRIGILDAFSDMIEV